MTFFNRNSSPSAKSKPQPPAGFVLEQRPSSTARPNPQRPGKTVTTRPSPSTAPQNQNRPAPPDGFVLETPEMRVERDRQTRPTPPAGFVLENAAPPSGYVPQPVDENGLSLNLPIPGSAGMPANPGQGSEAEQRYRRALANERANFPQMTDAEFAQYTDGNPAFRPYNSADLAAHGASFGLTDEASALSGGIGNLVLEGDFGAGWNERKEFEEARRDYGRELSGGVGTAAEIVGGVASLSGPVNAVVQGANTALRGGQATNGLVQTAKALGASTLEGAAYGAGSTDGGLQERATGAAVGGGLGFGAGAAGAIIGKGAQAVARNRSQNQALGQAVRNAPSAQAIKQQSKASYRAAEATGAEIRQPAMNILAHDARQLLKNEGLVTPAGRLADGFPRVNTALNAIEEYSSGNVSIEQLQILRRTVGLAAKSADKSEARIGGMLLDQLDDFAETLPRNAFARGDGERAVENLTQARVDYRRAAQTETLETAIDRAGLAEGGFDRAFRAELRKIVSTPKKARNFSAEDISAMRSYLGGNGGENLVRLLGQVQGMPAWVTGHILGGPAGSAALQVGGALARRQSNRSAQRAADTIRANVAYPNGLAPNVRPAAPGRDWFEGSRSVARGTNPGLADQREALRQVIVPPASRFSGVR